MINLTLGVASLVVWLYMLVGRGRFWRSNLFEAVVRTITCSMKANGRASRRSCRRATRPRSSAKPSLRWRARIILVPLRSWWWTIRAPMGRRVRRGARRRETVTVLKGKSPAGGRKGLGHGAGGRGGGVCSRAAGISFVRRRRHCAWGTRSSRSGRAREGSRGPRLSDGEAALRKPGGTLARSRVRFLFQMLYPFSWVENPGRSTAAAAGGCMLVRRQSLAKAGGLEALRGALIDDCALAALIKRRGRIWLGLTEDAFSLRAYPAFADFGRMVARSAFAQLRFSTLRLTVVMAAMGLVFLAPPCSSCFRAARRKRSPRPPG